MIPPSRSYHISLSFFLSFFLLSFFSLSKTRARQQTKNKSLKFPKSESATTSCSLVERIARTSGPASSRASNSNAHIRSRVKGTGRAFMEFEQRPTKRRILYKKFRVPFATYLASSLYNNTFYYYYYYYYYYYLTAFNDAERNCSINSVIVIYKKCGRTYCK